MTRRIAARMLIAGSLVTGGLVATAPPASADFHFMKITEVSDGTTIDPLAEFVELQMYSSGQNLVGGRHLRTYDSSGNLFQEFTLDSNVPGGDDQRTILIGTVSVGGRDLTESLDIPGNGAVCFENVDCVAWGSITNFANLTSPVTAAFPTAMPTELSLQRKITPNCPSLLENADDTNNSATDFEAAAPTPRSNSVTPTETPCAPGTVGGKPILQSLKAKVRGSRAIISGKILPPTPGKRVVLTFFAGGSPLRKISKTSATLNTDSRFKKGFRVPTDSTRCRVKVAFEGAPMGKRTFRC